MLTAFLPLCCPLHQNQVRAHQGLTVKGMEQWELLSYDTPEALNANWPSAEREDDFWLRREVMSF
ncbi:MAG: hypothetical protein AAF840_15060, partial [Bacteroidota bacterium]